MANLFTLTGLIDKDGNQYEVSTATIGDLQDLRTDTKANLVDAINELKGWQDTASISDSDIDALFAD